MAGPHPRIPSAAAAWALGVEVREVGTALTGEGVEEMEVGWRKVCATEAAAVFVVWLVWWRAGAVVERCRPLKTPNGQKTRGVGDKSDMRTEKIRKNVRETWI